MDDRLSRKSNLVLCRGRRRARHKQHFSPAFRHLHHEEGDQLLPQHRIDLRLEGRGVVEANQRRRAAADEDRQAARPDRRRRALLGRLARWRPQRLGRAHPGDAAVPKELAQGAGASLSLGGFEESSAFTVMVAVTNMVVNDVGASIVGCVGPEPAGSSENTKPSLWRKPCSHQACGQSPQSQRSASRLRCQRWRRKAEAGEAGDAVGENHRESDPDRPNCVALRDERPRRLLRRTRRPDRYVQPERPTLDRAPASRKASSPTSARC